MRRKPHQSRKLSQQQPLWQTVRRYLAQGWPPEQIAGRLKKDYPEQPDQHVSHETIYTAIYAHPKGELRRELVALLRQDRGARRPRTRGGDRRGQMPDLPSIHLRPLRQMSG